jgi:probable lipoprotein LpqN
MIVTKDNRGREKMIRESNKRKTKNFHRLLLAKSLVLLLIIYSYNFNITFGQLAYNSEISFDSVTNNNTDTNSMMLASKTALDSASGDEAKTVGFVREGTINSVMTVPDSKWIAIGHWRLTDDIKGNISSFEANTTWYNSNGASEHNHELQGLLEYQNVTSAYRGQADDIILTGVTDISTNNRTWWNDVPISISIKGEKVVAITIDDYKTNHHFIGQPILGIVTSFLSCSDLTAYVNEVSNSCDRNKLKDINLAPSNATIDNSTLSKPVTSVNGTSSRNAGESEVAAESGPTVSKNDTSQASISTKNFSHALSQDSDQRRIELNQNSTSEVISTSNDVTNDLPINNETFHDKLLIYENTTDGIRISYPSQWRLQEGRIADPSLLIAAKFYPSGDNNSPFTIAIRDLRGNVSLASYANDTVNRYMEGLDEFGQSHFSTNTTLSGYDAYVIEGTYIDEVSVKNRLREVGTILNNTAYILQFSSAEHKFPRYLAAFEQMIHSFQIIPISAVSDNAELNKTESIPREAINSTTIHSSDKGSNTSESVTTKESTTTPTRVLDHLESQQPTLMVTVSTPSNITLRGEDQTITINALDSSSNTGLADVEIDGIIVDGEEADTLIADSNNSSALRDIDIDDLDGEEFSGETDANGQLIESVEIPESFEEGNLAIVVAAEADGYDPVTIVTATTGR